MVGDLATVRERCSIGEQVVIGRGVCVENDTTIGSFTKIQSNAYITAHCLLEEHVFIAPCVVTTNDKNRYTGSTTGIEIAHIAHEYLAPYRSHAHCQMRSMR